MVVVVLRDGRRLFGVLRSYDQYANLVLQDTVERIYLDDSYGEQKRGVYIVRGENVALLGEIDPEKAQFREESRLPGALSSLKQVPFEEIEKQLDQRLQVTKKKDKSITSNLHQFGLCSESLLDNLY
jgi:U6 snRNA-associated Sm-like protein LSm1